MEVEIGGGGVVRGGLGFFNCGGVIPKRALGWEGEGEGMVYHILCRFPPYILGHWTRHLQSLQAQCPGKLAITLQRHVYIGVFVVEFGRDPYNYYRPATT